MNSRLLLCVLFGWSTFGSVFGSKDPNIVVIELSEVGRDGLRFDTPAYDSLTEESVFFPYYYTGYQNGASKSQLMTGVHSFYAGYGQIGNEFEFGHAMIGGVPLKHSMISEFFKAKKDSNYNTYYVGTWDLGYSFSQQTPNSRGFDYFYGSYTNENDIFTKSSKYNVNKYTDPSKIVNDNSEYFDFWENDKMLKTENIVTKDSVSLFTDKALEIVANNKESSFYLHVSYQGPTKYFENSKFEFSKDIRESTKCNEMLVKNNEKVGFSCQYTKYLDNQIGKIVKQLKDSNVWDNTLLLIVSDNGGDLSSGACNYPLRGGKNSYFEGNVRTLAMVSGGVIPESRRGIELNGLISNVDWAPTILSFAGMISHDTKSVSSFDGINMYNYIMNDDDTSSLGYRDHVMFHLAPWGHDNYKVYTDEGAVTRAWGWEETTSEYYITLNEIAMVFYDDNGQLWKYFVIDDYFDDENQNGLAISDETRNINYNWCVEQDNDNNVFEYTNLDFGNNVGVLSGLFLLTNDVSEQDNLLTTISNENFLTLKEIVKEKADYYLSNDFSSHANTLYNGVMFGKDCFYDRKNVLSYKTTTTTTTSAGGDDDDDDDDVWLSFVSSHDKFNELLLNSCGLSTEHALYELYAGDLNDANTLVNEVTTSSKTYEMHDSQRISKVDKLSDQSEYVVTSNSIDDKMTESSFTVYDKYIMNENGLMKDIDNVYSSCDGLEDGFYYIQIDLDSSYAVVKTQCSNGYMIINYALDNNWDNYFVSFFQSHSKVASPYKTDALDWQSWFIPDTKTTVNSENDVEYDYIVSPNCNECNENSLYQTSGLSTTYWENAVNSYCATNARGQPAGDAKWQSYTCRESVYNHGTSKSDITSYNLLYSTFVYDWIVSDLNGIDKTVLLTGLAGGNTGTLGTCLTMKESKDMDHFASITECEKSDVGNGNVPTIGIQGEYCVCAKKQSSDSSYLSSKVVVGHHSETPPMSRKLTDEEHKQVNVMAGNVKTMKEESNKLSKDATSNTYYLYQSDFTSGTYRIRKEGTYILMEDIVFDYNAPDYDNDEDYSANSVYSDDGDLYWYPKRSQMSEYPGAYQFHDPYLLGFFAGITIESDNVIIDLNSHSLSMDTHYFYQQPWWSHIEIGSQAFVPGEGPSHFGATPQYVKNVEIKNGVLGLTSHHCIHGTAPEASLMSNIVIENIVCKDFVTHGIQLNGFNGLTIENVEIGPNSNMQYLTVDYSQMRTLLPRFEYFADLYENEKTFSFGGKPSKDYILENNIAGQVSLNNEDEFTLRDILDEMILQMDMAFDYVTKRKTEDELHEEYGSKWLQAKRVFVFDYQSGIPYGGVIYGLYLNYPSSGISGFYRNTDKSYNVNVKDLYVHDITHASFEAPYLLKNLRSLFALPISAKFWLGDEILTNFNDLSSAQYEDEQVYYFGSIVYDWLVAFYSALRDDINNVEATNLLYFSDSAIDWVQGAQTMTGTTLKQQFFVTCNGDPMFHSVKGIFGFRIANVENVNAENVVIENLNELSPLGSDICGEYERSHAIQQQLPYLYGFTGNNLHGISIIDSSVLFKNLEMSNLNSLTGNSTGISVYPGSKITFDGSNNDFSSIIAGSQFLQSGYDVDTVSQQIASPNQLPRACAIKLEDFNEAESSIEVLSLNSENNNDDTFVNVECINGYVSCNDELLTESRHEKYWSNFGNSIKDECSEEQMSDIKETTNSLINLQPKSTVIYKPKSTQSELMQDSIIRARVADDAVVFSTVAAIVLITSVVLFGCAFAVISYKNNFSELSAKMNGYERI